MREREGRGERGKRWWREEGRDGERGGRERDGGRKRDGGEERE